MARFYTAFFIRKSDRKLLRRFDAKATNTFFWKKEIDTQLNKLLNNNLDLERRDIEVKEMEGVQYEY
jgi:hypothetical protein